MLVIRLFRISKKNQPSFKIMVTDKRKPPRGGRFIEEVGFWNPLKNEKILRAERIKYWLSVGAKPSATIYNLLISEKIVDGKKIPKHKKPKKESKLPMGQAEKKEEKAATAETPVGKRGKPKEEKKVSEKPPEKAPEKKKETAPPRK